MPRNFALHSALLAFCTAGNASSLPFYAQPVESFEQGTTLPPGTIRFRLSVAASDEFQSKDVRMGPVTICSDSQCFRPQTPDTVDLTNSRNGTSIVIADAVIPNDTIRGIYFDSVAGVQTIDGSIKLAQPLALEAGYPSGELFLALEMRIDKNQFRYFPTASSGTLFNQDLESIYYNPKYPLSIELKMGVHIDIPAHATVRPQIFCIGINDVGDEFPDIDIFPRVKLAKPAKIIAHVIVRRGPNDQPTTTPIVSSIPPENFNGASTPPEVELPRFATREIEIEAAGPVNFNRESNSDHPVATTRLRASGINADTYR